jgi:flagellar biosynthesis/type III secretory pathway M-ring protein FliF/YscJ
LFEILLVLVVLAVVVLVVSAPLRRPRVAPEPGRVDEAELEAARDEVAELEAARDAKYREIRDAELDHRTGKLSDADHDATDSTLRGEAIEILRALDRARQAS